MFWSKKVLWLDMYESLVVLDVLGVWNPQLYVMASEMFGGFLMTD